MSDEGILYDQWGRGHPVLPSDTAPRVAELEALIAVNHAAIVALQAAKPPAPADLKPITDALAGLRRDLDAIGARPVADLAGVRADVAKLRTDVDALAAAIAKLTPPGQTKKP